MTYEPHKCLAGCGKTITWNFAICSDCERIYGKSSKDWPEWLRASWSMTQHQRRKDKEFYNNEMTTSDLTANFDKSDMSDN